MTTQSNMLRSLNFNGSSRGSSESHLTFTPLIFRKAFSAMLTRRCVSTDVPTQALGGSVSFVYRDGNFVSSRYSHSGKASIDRCTCSTHSSGTHLPYRSAME